MNPFSLRIIRLPHATKIMNAYKVALIDAIICLRSV